MTELGELVATLRARHGIPGAVVGVSEDGRTEAVAAGIANLNSGVEMTPDTLFLTGSITKVWTTTLLMSLVEQGMVDLGSPVKRYLPDFALGDADVVDELVVSAVNDATRQVGGALGVAILGSNLAVTYSAAMDSEVAALPDEAAAVALVGAAVTWIFLPARESSRARIDFDASRPIR